MTQTTVLDELNADGARIQCTAEVAVALEASGLVRVERYREGRYLLRPCGKVGAVRIGDLQVEVRPKDRVPLASALFLLSYAQKPGFRDDHVEMSRDDDVFTALAAALVRQAGRAVMRGLHRGYVTVDETSRTLRGRIRMGDQVRLHQGRDVPVEITFDEYSPDVAENRIMLTALRQVLRIPRLPDDIYAHGSTLLQAFAGVSELDMREPVPHYALTRLTARYGPALTLAELVLRHQSLQLGAADGLPGVSFVVSMETVYEDFVGVALRESLERYPGYSTMQFGSYLDEPQLRTPRVSMSVDFVHQVDGQPIIVADAKYKADSGSGRYPNADKYQMLAYCTALGVECAWLVYAAGGESVFRRVRNTATEIVDWPLDLARTPDEILAQVDALADAMATQAGMVPKLAGRQGYRAR